MKLKQELDDETFTLAKARLRNCLDGDKELMWRKMVDKIMTKNRSKKWESFLLDEYYVIKK